MCKSQDAISYLVSPFNFYPNSQSINYSWQISKWPYFYFTHNFITRFCNSVVFNRGVYLIQRQHSPLIFYFFSLLWHIPPITLLVSTQFIVSIWTVSKEIPQIGKVKSWQSSLMPIFSKMKVKCQVVSNFFYITNLRIHLEFSFLTLQTLWKVLPTAETVTYPV